MSQKPWLAHYDEGVPESIDYPRIPLDKRLRDSAAKHPNHTALIYGSAVGSRIMDATMTYSELDAAVDSFAASLQGRGVKPGDRVTIMLPNCPQFVIAAYATWRIGAIVVCCNPLYVAREVEHLLNDSGSETMIVLSQFYERVKQVRPKSKLRQVIVTNVKEYFPRLLSLMFTLTKEKKDGHKVDISGDSDTFWFQDVLKEGGGKPRPVEIDADSVATLIYTGGTTGVPKGVQQTHYNLISNAMALNVWGKTREAIDVMIAVMPFFHSYGLTVGMTVAIAQAMSVVLIPNPRETVHVLGSIEKHKATFYPGVPTMFVAFNNHPDRDKYDLSSLRAAFSAAAPLPREVQEQFEEITGGRLLEAYGLTETGPTLTGDPMDNPRPNTIGLPLPDTDLRIVDVETGSRELPVGEAGEIIACGPQIMKGYWQLPTETANAIRQGPDGKEGWFFTGDIGYMDEEGFFHISDRKKDMIIAGGYNIYPADVEGILYEHPKILEAAVIGVPDPVRGESVKAFVVLKEGQTATAEEIEAFCRENLAAYKVPRQVEFISDLPKSVVGKILRRELRQPEE
jgi:long-chain acyl-CoA synthetase